MSRTVPVDYRAADVTMRITLGQGWTEALVRCDRCKQRSYPTRWPGDPTDGHDTWVWYCGDCGRLLARKTVAE